MRIDGYLRVSRVAGREGERFISPAVQRERIRAAAKAQGHQVVKIHEDLDLPGSHSERPGLQTILSRIERGTVQGVIVARLDRFGRSTIDIHRNLERIRQAGGELLTVAEGIDTSGPFGRFITAIMAALAELELERIRESWQIARERAVARGVHVASRTPTGYVRLDDGRLSPGPDAARISGAFEAASRGASWGELAALLEGVKTPYGSTRWTARSISHVLANRAYLGEARSGEFKLADAHEPLVSEVIWQAAQRKPGERSASGKSLLAGILRCAGCRYVMKPDTMRTRSGERVRSYRCRGTRSHGDCEARAAVLGSVVEPWITEQLFERAGIVRLRGVSASQSLADAERELAEATAERDAYRDSAVVSVIGRSSYLEGLRARQERAIATQHRVDELRSEAGLAELGSQAELQAAWEGMAIPERRHVLGRAVDAVFVRQVGRANVPIAERARILWRGEAPNDLPGPGRKLDAIRPFDW